MKKNLIVILELRNTVSEIKKSVGGFLANSTQQNTGLVNLKRSAESIQTEAKRGKKKKKEEQSIRDMWTQSFQSNCQVRFNTRLKNILNWCFTTSFHLHSLCVVLSISGPLDQWSPTFLAPGTTVWKTIFPQTGVGGWGSCFQDDSSALRLLGTLFLLLLHCNIK